MPGKQMAIDADLNSGLIDQNEARARREEVGREADFYGAMDGASKFVRGDAIAGILILMINIIGGLSIGMGQHDLDLGTAVRFYALLTIGDGLVAQLPSLLLSTSAAIIVTRVSHAEDLGSQVSTQLLDNPRALFITAATLVLLGLIPGMPNLVFLLLGAAVGGLAYMVARRHQESRAQPETAAPIARPEEGSEVRELTWQDVQPVDVIGLEVGYRLIPLVDREQGGQLMNRIKGVRKKLSQELGFLVQSVHIRDNLDLSPNAYRITLHGVPVGESEVFVDRELAINPGRVFGELRGTPTTDPAFGLEAVWIDAAQRDQAQTMGYTVVDASTVVATHMSELLQSHAHELLGHDEVQQLLDNLAQVAPKLVEDLVPKLLPLAVVLRVLQNLLQEGVAIRDMRSIAETLAEQATKSQDAGTLTAAVRVALARSIVQQVVGPKGEIPVIVLEPGLERLLQQTLANAGEDGAGVEPGMLEQLQGALKETAQQQELSGHESVLLVAAAIRPWMAKFARHSVPGLRVLSYNEIPDNRQIKVISTIGRNATEA
jgi:flagellar biosynthesis protein FlhA